MLINLTKLTKRLSKRPTLDCKPPSAPRNGAPPLSAGKQTGEQPPREDENFKVQPVYWFIRKPD